MATWKLLPFKETSQKLEVSLSEKGYQTILSYYLTDTEDNISLPDTTPNALQKANRVNGLWESTCFELFGTLSDPTSAQYEEWNFSPTGDWNCFSFDQYREGMKEVMIEKPIINFQKTPETGTATVQVTLPFSMSRYKKVNITSVLLEEREGEKYFHYFALNHNFQGKPDFHDVSLYVPL